MEVGEAEPGAVPEAGDGVVVGVEAEGVGVDDFAEVVPVLAANEGAVSGVHSEVGAGGVVNDVDA